MTMFNERDWYWFVGGDESRVFSSASGDYVQPDNTAYLAWLDGNRVPTRIASADELGEVMATYTIRPTNADVLDKYQGTHANKLTVKVIAKVLFYFANEIRTLNGQPPINASQFRSFLKRLM